MQKEYWDNFYKGNHINKPTDFAKFSREILLGDIKMVELGCGNGRDTYYFGKKFNIVGVDFAAENKPRGGARFVKQDIRTFIDKECDYDAVYCRFLFHAIEKDLVRDILKWSKGILLAEFRASGDEPVVYKNHKREFIDDRDFINLLYDCGFDIVLYAKGRGLAKFRNEDPLIIRVIANK